MVFLTGPVHNDKGIKTFLYAIFLFLAKSKGNILHDVVDEKVDETWVQVKALREDISLLGFSPLAEIHGRLDISWNKNVKCRKLLEVKYRK